MLPLGEWRTSQPYREYGAQTQVCQHHLPSCYPLLYHLNLWEFTLLQAEHMVEMLSRELRTKQADLDRAEGNWSVILLIDYHIMQSLCDIGSTIEATLVKIDKDLTGVRNVSSLSICYRLWQKKAEVAGDNSRN